MVLSPVTRVGRTVRCDARISSTDIQPFLDCDNAPLCLLIDDGHSIAPAESEASGTICNATAVKLESAGQGLAQREWRMAYLATLKLSCTCPEYCVALVRWPTGEAVGKAVRDCSRQSVAVVATEPRRTAAIGHFRPASVSDHQVRERPHLVTLLAFCPHSCHARPVTSSAGAACRRCQRRLKVDPSVPGGFRNHGVSSRGVDSRVPCPIAAALP